jgi:adenylate kinase
MTALNLFIIGPSGCGKSTQAELISKKYNLSHISTGEAFRNEMEGKTPLGIEAKSYVDRGIWVPTPIVIRLFIQEVTKVNNQNFIVDGTPRLPDQCPAIEEYLKSCHQPVSALIHLDVTFEEIFTRRSKMGQSFQDKDRTDTNPEAVKKRLSEYLENNDPIMEYFQKRNILIRVDGNRPIEPIFNDICLAIDNI